MSGANHSARSWSRFASGLVWPVISLASVGWSLWLLQAKLEAEASSDPAVRSLLEQGALWSDVKVISDSIGERLAQIPTAGYLLAGLATLAAYVMLAWYDRIALMHLGRLKGISWLYTGVSSFVAYALGHNVGASVLSGGAVRLRAYSAKGLSKAEVAGLVGMCSFTFVFGTVLSLGVVLLLEPEVLAAVGHIVPALSIPETGIRLVGSGLLCICLLYVGGSLLRFRPFRFGSFEIAYPNPSVVGRQLVAAPMELVAAAGIIYFALPDAGNPGFFIVLGAFLISFSAGLLSQVPGGIGVMEAVFLALLPEMAATSVMAALLVWRLLYLLIPLALSGPIIIAFEHMQFRRRG
jgi:glycosyltransferase 2 family protein